MELKDRIRAAVGFNSRALELGPSYNPIIAKRDGYQTTVLDHAPREVLREKYSGYAIDAARIEEVDVVTTSLREVPGKFDHIVASHFVEHTPDLIGFLREVDALLNEGGKLHLIVPDRRGVFDALRSPTSTGEVIDAHLLGRKRHVGAIFDTFASAVSKGDQMLWQRGEPGPYVFKHNYLDARQHTLAAMMHNEYVDTHAWCFGPSSFRMIAMDVLGLGLTNLDVVEWQSDPVEFYCVMARPEGGVDLQELSDRRNKLRLEVVEEAFSVYAPTYPWRA